MRRRTATPSQGVYTRLLASASLPVVAARFWHAPIPLADRMRLLRSVRRTKRSVETASSVVEHLAMIGTLLTLPAEVEGCVVECGTFRGGSAANLSLAAAAAGRRLHVFDSFAGLPAPEEADRSHTVLGLDEVHSYDQGAFAAPLDEVRANIARYGRLSVCEFHAGDFAETLPAFTEPCALIFVDVDLRRSLEVCVSHLWPLLAEGGVLFTHEAQHLEIASLFYDDGWWRANLGTPAPGLVGAGGGLGLQPARDGFASQLGRCAKGAPRRVRPQRGGASGRPGDG